MTNDEKLAIFERAGSLFVNDAAQVLDRLGVLRRLGYLGLRRCNLLIALGDLLLVIGLVTAYLRLALLPRFLLLLALLLRRVLRTLRGFLAAIGLTVHVPSCLEPDHRSRGIGP